MLVYKFLPLLLLTVFHSIAQALDYTYTTNNGAITITSYTGSGGDVSIPGTINDLPVTTIEDYAFDGCANLTSIIIPDSVTSDLKMTFSGCSGLTNVTIGSGVTTIAAGAFYGCTSLPHITLPDSVTTIGYGKPFSQCTSLTNIIFGSGVKYIDFGVAKQSPLTAITVDEDNVDFSSVNGILFNKDQTTLFQYPAGKVSRSYAIPGSVTTIGDYAFDGCGLASITISDTVTNIGHSAFGVSDGLNGVYFRGNAPSLVSTSTFLPYEEPQPFDNSPNVIVYYLPGTMGWGAMFGERPTAVWKPRIEVKNESFGTSTNQFGFNIVWASGQEIVVEANASLTNSVWQSLKTNTLSSDSLYFSDTQWTNYPSRFYRISSP